MRQTYNHFFSSHKQFVLRFWQGVFEKPRVFPPFSIEKFNRKQPTLGNQVTAIALWNLNSGHLRNESLSTSIDEISSNGRGEISQNQISQV